MATSPRGLRRGHQLRASDGTDALHDDGGSVEHHHFTIRVTTTVPRWVILMMLKGWFDVQPWLYDDVEVK